MFINQLKKLFNLMGRRWGRNWGMNLQYLHSLGKTQHAQALFHTGSCEAVVSLHGPCMPKRAPTAKKTWIKHDVKVMKWSVNNFGRFGIMIKRTLLIFINIDKGGLLYDYSVMVKLIYRLTNYIWWRFKCVHNKNELRTPVSSYRSSG